MFLSSVWAKTLLLGWIIALLGMRRGSVQSAHWTPTAPTPEVETNQAETETTRLEVDTTLTFQATNTNGVTQGIDSATTTDEGIEEQHTIDIPRETIFNQGEILWCVVDGEPLLEVVWVNAESDEVLEDTAGLGEAQLDLTNNTSIGKHQLRCEGRDRRQSGDVLEVRKELQCDVIGEDDSKVTKSLDNLAQVNVTDENALSTAEKLKNLTSDSRLLETEGISKAVEVVENIVTLEQIEVDVGQSVLASVDQLLTANQTVLNETQENLTNLRISMDALGEKLVVNNTNGTEVIRETNVALAVSETNTTIGFGRSVEQDLIIIDNETRSGRYQDSVILPMADICSISGICESGDIRVYFILYDNDATNIFLPNLPNSSVLSATVVTNQTINNLPRPVELTFGVENVTIEGEDPCRFFNDADEKGWSSTGCVRASSAKVENDSIKCHCNHTTNFAVLFVDPRHATNDTKILSIIGTTLSMIGLILTMISVVLVNCTNTNRRNILRRKEQRNAHATLVNLAVALLLFYITFLIGDSQIGRTGACIAVSSCSLYFLLVAFGWMLVEGIVQYIKYVSIMPSLPEKFVEKAAIPVWILPTVFVSLAVMLDRLVCSRDLSCMWDSGNEEMLNGTKMASKIGCWPLYDSHLSLFYIVPVCSVIMTNAIIYIIVMLNTMVFNEKIRSTRRKSVCNDILQSLACLVVLGVTWVFAFWSFEYHGDPFTLYIFILLNSLQGFWIFSLYCLRSPRVREAWLGIFASCGCTRDRRESSVSSTDLID